MCKKVVIIANGFVSDYSYIKQIISGFDDRYVVCCDGGVNHAFNMNILPDMVLGDMDSADTQILNYFKEKNMRFITYPPEKDCTDLELAIDYVIDNILDINSIYIFASTGGRLDHTLGNVHSLIRAVRRKIAAYIEDEECIITVIDKTADFKLPLNSIVSLIPITTQVIGVTTYGFSYPLCNEVLSIGSCRGISNVTLENSVRVEIVSGLLAVFITKKY